MTYTVKYDPRVEKEIDDLPDKEIKKIDRVIISLHSNPRPKGSKKLKGPQFESWRIRIGNYRILYFIDDEKKEVSIYKVGHRKEVYR